MDQNPTAPHAAEPEPDVPRPPIWQEQLRGETPPAAPRITAPVPIIEPAGGLDRQGPSLGGREFLALSGSRSSTNANAFALSLASLDKPQWPVAPPTAPAGPTVTSPAVPAGASRSRVGLIVLAFVVAAALAAGSFFFGRSFASSETAAGPLPVLDPESAPTTAPPPTEAPATAVPVPTPIPALPSAPAPSLAIDGATEPVAAVAAAVAPAVVLIQNDIGQGSGIIYDASGLILTNAHVVGSFTEVTVQLASGVKVEGEVLGADPLTDVAVVKITTAEPFGVAPLAPQSSVVVGQLAVAIGSPFGLDQTVTSGVVSAVGRVIQNQTADGQVSAVAMIQTDAPINPGNSGGALADRQGRVIGMNTSIRTDGTGGNIGVGFAIPADTAKLIADRIIAGQPLERGFLGVGGVTPQFGTPGVVVTEITPGSGADNAGILPGDLITSFNGQAIRSIGDLAAAVRLQEPNATVTIEYQREGQVVSTEVVLGTLLEG